MRKWLLIGVLALLAPDARAAKMILNEYNAVSATSYLNGGTAGADEDGGTAAGPRLRPRARQRRRLVRARRGRRSPRRPRLEARPLRQRRVQRAARVQPERALGGPARGHDHHGGRGRAPPTSRYNPAGGDWTINVQAIDGGRSAYITPNSFPVSNDNWQITIRTRPTRSCTVRRARGSRSNPATGCNPPPVGVNSREMFKLEADPSALVERCSHSYNDGKSSTFGAPNVWNGGADRRRSFTALRQGLPIPDRDTDGVAGRRRPLGRSPATHPCTSGATTRLRRQLPGRAEREPGRHRRGRRRAARTGSATRASAAT